MNSRIACLLGAAAIVVAMVAIGCPKPPNLDAVGPDGLSLRGRACGEVLRERVEKEIETLRDPERFPGLREAGLREQAIQQFRGAAHKVIREVEQRVTETGDWGPCADAVEGGTALTAEELE